MPTPKPYECPYCLAGDCYTKALMTEPTNWKSLLDSSGHWKGPSGGFKYRVQTGMDGKSWENWFSVALKDGWSDARDLIEYNFKTKDPKEVNWYLYHFVGCKISVDGNLNLTFKYAKPGIIYTKKNHFGVDVPPPPKILPKPNKPLFTRGMTWVGIGGKVGGMSFTSGNSNAVAYMVNVTDPDCRFFLTLDTRRTGWGAGASVSTIGVLVTGLYDPSDVRHAPSGEIDFDVAIAGKWGAVAKNLKSVPRLTAMARAAAAMRHIKSPSALATFATSAKSIWAAAGADMESTKLKVTVVDLPIGAGLEGSLYWGESTYKAHDIIMTKDEWEDYDFD
ncbi:MAG: hypothetical protein U5J83_04775 [Bryobacterales bacterium]|nr:hypothetical protein [Bryobacterales bacterium]